MSSKITNNWWAVYNSEKAEYQALCKGNEGYRTFGKAYKTKDTCDAVALAKALNEGAEVCCGSIAHGNNCRKCVKCRYSF